MAWHAFDDGKTVGTLGSENGTITRDEEHDGGARVTLERGESIAPYSITCGVYGWMAHTRFFGDKVAAESEFDLMKAALDDLLAKVPYETDPDAKTKSQEVVRSIEQFIEAFP